jgi:sec-independent protein translocase protein TatB
VARTLGAWIGRLNRFTAQIKADIDREMRLDELRGVQQSMKESVQKYEIMAEEAGQQIKKETDEVRKAVQEVPAQGASAAAPSSVPESVRAPSDGKAV